MFSVPRDRLTSNKAACSRVLNRLSCHQGEGAEFTLRSYGTWCRDGGVKHQWGATEPWALHGVVGLLLRRDTLYVLSANAQLYCVPVLGGRTSPPVSLKVRFGG